MRYRLLQTLVTGNGSNALARSAAPRLSPLRHHLVPVVCGSRQASPSSAMAACEDQRMRLIIQAAALVAVVQVWLLLRRAAARNCRPRLTYGPMLARDQERIANMNYIYNNNDVEAVGMLRMRRAPFNHLCNTFRVRGLLKDNIHTSIEEQVAMFLNVLGHNQRFRVIHSTWRRSTETISRYFRQVLYAVGELRDEMIRPPGSQTPQKIAESQRWFPNFKDCIGAIDGTHVTTRIPRCEQAAYRGRKHFPTQNVLAAVDFDMRFTYVLAGWEGSAHDATILADSLESEDGLKIPKGKFYLADAGYACRPGILPPFRSTRYHLNEFSSRNYPRTAKELFNLRHSSLRVTVERVFAALKNRFKILDQKPFHPYRTHVKLVLACCILHNWILAFGVDDFFPEESDVVPDDNDDDASGGHGVAAHDNAAWKNKRQQWADDMWENRGSFRI